MGDPTPLGTAYFFIKFALCVRPFIGIAYGERFVVSISIKTGIKLCVTYIGHIVFPTMIESRFEDSFAREQSFIEPRNESESGSSQPIFWVFAL